MKKKYFISVAILLFGVQLFGKVYTPQRISLYGPINVVKPLLIDSTDLKGNKFSDENLLSTFINFPNQSQFNTSITPDNNYFRFQKPVGENAFYLLSFDISSNNYCKAKLKITAPDRFEIYMNNQKLADKKTKEDTLSTAKSAEANLVGNLNANRIVVKYLASSKSILSPAVKIEIIPDKSDSTTVFSFDSNGKRRLTIQDILVGKRVNSASISPSGRFVLMNFATTNNEGKTQGSIEVFDSRQNRTILAENSNRSQLHWMPKSDLLSYVESNENGNCMYTLNPLTNEKTLIAKNLPNETFQFSTDEKSLFYSKKEILPAQSPKGLKRILDPEDRQEYFRNRYFIYQYHLDSGIAQQLTFGQNTANIEDLTDDGNYLLFSTVTEDLSERPFSKNSMFLLNLQTMKVDTLWLKEKYITNAKFSPDGVQLVVTGGPDAFNGIGLNIKQGQIANSYDTQAFIFDIATKQVTPITKYFKPAVVDFWWNKLDRKIYFKVEDKDYVDIYRFEPQKQQFEKIALKEELVQTFSLAKNSLNAAYVGSSTTNSRRAYLIDLNKQASKLLSDPFAGRLSEIELGKVENWSYVNQRGDTIDGRFYLPPHFDPTKKYPLIVYYYGGTSPTQRTFESTYPLQVYAGMDYVVYTLNPSGTTGYGQEFAARHVNAWGDYTVDDIIEGTKAFVASHAFVNGQKIGCIGASYGGFMTQYLLTKTDLFAAAVSHAGISALSSYWGGGYWGYTYSAGASADSYPWNNKQLYVEHSPLFNADKIKTPLLLLHGTADTNVPPTESIQMFTALKLLGKPVELVMVEGENHGIYDFDKRIQWNYTIYAWFAKWLKDNSNWWNDLYPDK